MSDTTARKIHFSGTVQGVGFRYTATSLARNYQVTGYVMNLPDDRVEIYVEGPESDVNNFIQQVRSEMGNYILNVEANDVEPTGNYKRFVVRYY